MMGPRRLAVVALLIAAASLSCKGDGEPGDLLDDLYLPEQDRSLRSLTVEAERLILEYDRDARTVGLSEGLLVAGGSQGGYLRSVEQVGLVGTTAFLQTRDATLTEAVAVGTLHHSVAPTGAWQLEPDGGAAEMTADGGLDLGGMVLFDGYSGESDLVVAIDEGSLHFDPTVQLDIVVEDSEVRQLAVEVSGPLVLDLTARMSLDLKYSYTTEVPLASYRVPFSTTMGQVPVAGEIQVLLHGGFELYTEAGGDMRERARFSSHLRAGAVHDGTEWASIWSVQQDAEAPEDPEWNFDAEVEFRLWVAPEIQVTFYGAPGAEVALRPFVNADLAEVAPPQWTLSAGLEGRVAFDPGFLDADLSAHGEDFAGETVVVAVNDDTWIGWAQLSAGDGFNCGLSTAGKLGCWGDDTQGQASPPTGEYTAVTAGNSHACALRGDGSVSCWGRCEEGQCTPPPGTYVQVEAGHDFTCGVTDDGEGFCWGDDSAGQASPPDFLFTQVSAGTWHGCGVTTFGGAACWGDDADGQATPPGGDFESLSARWRHTCGIQPGGAAVCWGCGQFDNGQCEAPPGTYVQISAGRNHSCALNHQERVACWGSDGYGQSQPPLGWFSQVSAGHDHTCAVRTSGEVACWGNDDQGQATPPENAP